MFELKVIKDALSIDRAEKRWSIRFLFLLVFIIETLSLIYPIGNPDLYITIRWSEAVIEAIRLADPAALTISSLPQMPIEVIYNFIYIVFVVLKLFFYLLIMFYAASLYIGERKKILPTKIFVQYIKRLPWLLVYLFVLCILLFVFMMVTIIMPFLIFLTFLIIPFLFLSANLIIIDKKNPVDAWIYCVRYSRGKRFWLLSQVLVIYLIYHLASSLLSIFVSSNSIGAMMIGAALFSYLLCAIGRLSGIYYYKVNVSELFV